MRHGVALPALAVLLLVAPTAVADNLGSIEATAGESPVVKPGEQGEVRFSVHYCYSTPPIAPANVDVTLAAAPEWLNGQASPNRFSATTNGAKCGDKEVALQFAIGRGAPAFKPEAVRVKFAGTGKEREATAIVQAGYWAEVQLTKPATARAAKGDLGTITLEVGISANEATRLEITGRDPQQMLNILGYSASVPGAGTGLDNKVTQRIPLTVTASPGAPAGVRSITLNVTTHYERSPTIVGETEQIAASVEVTGGGGPTPGPGVALLALGIAGMAWLARRRGR